MLPGDEQWLDREAGPVVRPYALTRGRTRPPGADLGLIDMVTTPSQAARAPRPGIGPEQRRLMQLCQTPVTVADLASEIDLPLGVVRVLLGDLCEGGLLTVVGTGGQSTAEESVIKSVLDGLRTL